MHLPWPLTASVMIEQKEYIAYMQFDEVIKLCIKNWKNAFWICYLKITM